MRVGITFLLDKKYLFTRGRQGVSVRVHFPLFSKKRGEGVARQLGALSLTLRTPKVNVSIGTRNLTGLPSSIFDVG